VEHSIEAAPRLTTPSSDFLFMGRVRAIAANMDAEGFAWDANRLISLSAGPSPARRIFNRTIHPPFAFRYISTVFFVLGTLFYVHILIV